MLALIALVPTNTPLPPAYQHLESARSRLGADAQHIRPGNHQEARRQPAEEQIGVPKAAGANLAPGGNHALLDPVFDAPNGHAEDVRDILLGEGLELGTRGLIGMRVHPMYRRFQTP